MAVFECDVHSGDVQIFVCQTTSDEELILIIITRSLCANCILTHLTLITDSDHHILVFVHQALQNELLLVIMLVFEGLTVRRWSVEGINTSVLIMCWHEHLLSSVVQLITALITQRGLNQTFSKPRWHTNRHVMPSEVV